MSSVKVTDYKVESTTENTTRIKLFLVDGSSFQYENLNNLHARLLIDILRNEAPIFFNTQTSTLRTGQEPAGEEEGKLEALNVMTLNVRIPKDKGTNSWTNRHSRIVNMLKSYESGAGPHIVGMQELEHNQWTDLRRDLPNYGAFSKDRGDGESLAIFYRNDRLECLEQGHFFLGQWERRAKGYCPSIFFKHDFNSRVVVWCRFRDKFTDKTFYVYNTHFPSKDSCERRGSAVIMDNGIDQRTHTSDPVIAMGDFNDGQRSDGQLNSSFRIFLERSGLVNSYRVVHDYYPGEEFSTSNSKFKNVRTGSGNDGRMIDFVLVSPQSIKVFDANIDRTMFTNDGQLVKCNQIDAQGLCTGTNYKAKDLKMYSDHWAVWASLTITNP